MKLPVILIKMALHSLFLRTPKAIEFCGRQLNVAGSIAVVSVCGMMMSVMGCSVDQDESVAATQQVEKVVERVDKTILDDQSRQQTDPDNPFSFSSVNDKSDSYIHFGASHVDPLEWIESNTRKVPTYALWQFTITSDASEYNIHLAPYLVIDVVNVTPFPSHIVAVYKEEREGVEMARQFQVALKPSIGMIGAPHSNDNGSNPDVDHYSLAPGESEIYSISINHQPGYIYQFRIGVHYRFRGNEGVKWLPESYEIGTPDKPVNVIYTSQNRVANEIHPDNLSSLKQGVQYPERFFEKRYDTNEKFMRGNKYFKIEAISKD